MSRQRRGQYERLPQDVSPESSGRTFQERPENDIRFRYNPRVSPPWKSIIMAIFLLSLGSLLLILSYLIFTGHMRGAKDQAFGLLVLGLLVFLPGYYVSRLAYYSFRGRNGYSFIQIPT